MREIVVRQNFISFLNWIGSRPLKSKVAKLQYQALTYFCKTQICVTRKILIRNVHYILPIELFAEKMPRRASVSGLFRLNPVHIPVSCRPTPFKSPRSCRS